MLRAQLDTIISQALAFAPDTSDILFTVGKRPQAEVHGVLQDIPLQPALGPLLPFQIEEIAACMIGDTMRLYSDLVHTGSCDLAYALRDQGRFRVNIFHQQGSLAVVMRKLPQEVPTIQELNLPDIFYEVAQEKFGLVLVTGATGTGKTTSLAALVNEINATMPGHILTLEDPVEYVHPHQRGTVNQRELGVDFASFASGLRAALRQAPKVILVGEIRDRETVGIAMDAAETGHLVLGTLHTSDTGQTINRMIGMFELGEERLVRGRLAESLKFVISQRLMPREDKAGRVAAFEVLRRSLRIRDVIINGEDEERTFASVVDSSEAAGMFTFERSLMDLYRQGIISEDTALLHASDKSSLKKRIDRIKAERGEQVTDISGLELDHEYEDNVLKNS
ncbi:MAG: type IV pilus twitching motility protein PilT [Thermodesulfobacteriota bacterium]